MKLDDVIKATGIEDPRPSKEPFKKQKRPRPWLAEMDDTLDTGLNSKNQPGLISEDLAFKNNDDEAQKVGSIDPKNIKELSTYENQPGLISEQEGHLEASKPGLNFENQPGLLENQPGLNESRTNQPGLVTNQPGLKAEKQPGLKQLNEPGLNSPKASVVTTDERIRVLRKVKGNELLCLLYLFTRLPPGKSRETERVRNAEIQNGTGIRYESVRTAIQQSVTKKLVERIESKAGAQGWIRLKIAADTIEFFRSTDYQSGLKYKNQPGLNRPNQTGLFSLSSSSSDFNKKNIKSTTTHENSWVDEIFIPPSAQEHIGLRHVEQLMRMDFLQEVVQESVNNFAAALEMNLLTKVRSPASYFIGAMRRNSFFAGPDKNEKFDSHKAQKALQRNKEESERAIETEVRRIAEERLREAENPISQKGSLDDIPF